MNEQADRPEDPPEKIAIKATPTRITITVRNIIPTRSNIPTRTSIPATGTIPTYATIPIGATIPTRVAPIVEAVNVDVDSNVESLAMLRSEVLPSGNAELVNENKTLTTIEVPNVEEIHNESPPIGPEPSKSSPEIPIFECERQPTASEEKVPSTAEMSELEVVIAKQASENVRKDFIPRNK